MCAVAGEHHAAVHEAIHAKTGKGVNAGPLQRKLGVLAEQSPHSRQDVLRLFLLLGIGVPTQLKINAPDIVRLSVEQDALPRVKGRIKPEPPLSGKVRRHLHIGDKETISKDAPFALQPQVSTHG